ncbi:PLAC8 motif-containing protein [Phytophthora cactorum]|nr:PLAC8 motif-containing protein [Phytophthora cactorum]
METPYAVPVDDIVKPNANPAEVVVAIPVEEPKPDRDPSVLLGKWEAQFSRLGMTTYICALLTFVLLFSFTCGFAHAVLFVWIWQLRQLTRERFKIPGGCCEDYCASFWFPCCTLAQIATHIKSYKPGSCDFGPQDTLPAYK